MSRNGSPSTAAFLRMQPWKSLSCECLVAGLLRASAALVSCFHEQLHGVIEQRRTLYQQASAALAVINANKMYGQRKRSARLCSSADSGIEHSLACVYSSEFMRLNVQLTPERREQKKPGEAKRSPLSLDSFLSYELIKESRDNCDRKVVLISE